MGKESIVFYRKESKETLIKSASNAISEKLTLLLSKKIPVLFLVSGGSAFNILENIDFTGLSSLITLGVLDERYSSDPKVNNFLQLSQMSFYKRATTKGCNFIDSSIQNGESQTALRDRFEKTLKIWKEENPSGQILITQGIGPDGHTSGVLPFPEDPNKFKEMFLNPNVWVTSYDASGKNPYPLRVTTTLSFLKQVNFSYVFVCGEDKKTALSSTFDNKGSLPQTPARIIREMQQVSVFTDIV